MAENTGLEVYEGGSVPAHHVDQTLDNINKFTEILKNKLVKGQDYGVFGQVKKPVLLKSGAEKIVSIMGLWPEYSVENRIETWEPREGQWPLFHYEVRCRLKRASDGQAVGDGIGSCNSAEGRFRFRKDYNTGQRIERDPLEIPTEVNTIMKMAEKRALLQATLTIARISGMFTQDMEDRNDTPPQNQQQKPPPEKKESELNEDQIQNLKDAIKQYPQLREEFNLKGKKPSEVSLKDFEAMVARCDEIDNEQLDKAVENLGEEASESAEDALEEKDIDAPLEEHEIENIKEAVKVYPQLRGEFKLKGKSPAKLSREVYNDIMARTEELDNLEKEG